VPDEPGLNAVTNGIDPRQHHRILQPAGIAAGPGGRRA
jgi:hypothetical protein